MRPRAALPLIILSVLAPACSTPVSHADASSDAPSADTPASDVPRSDASVRDASVRDVAIDTPPGADAPAVDSTVADTAPPDDVVVPDDVPVATDVPPPDTRPAGYGRLGVTQPVVPPETLRTNPTVNFRGVDMAYDPASQVFLVVYGNAPIGGAFLDDDGHQVGNGFRITDVDYDSSNWSQNPRVAFGNGAFEVTWQQQVGNNVVAQAKRVRFTPGGIPAFDAPSVTVSDPGTNTNQESPVSLAFSPVSQEFMLAWAQNGLKARRMGADGSVQGSVVTVSPEGVWVEQPSVVYQPGCGCYVVAYASVEGSGGNVSMARLAEGTGTLLGAPVDLTGELMFSKVTDVELDQSTGEVLGSWYQVGAGVNGFGAERIGADGSAHGAIAQVFSPFGSYDGYDLSWSPVTGTSFGAFHGNSAEAWGAELDETGVNAPVMEVTRSGAASGFFLPRVVAHPTRPFWLVAGSADYTRVVVQRIDRSPAP